MKVVDCKCLKALVLPVGRRSMKGFPTIRPATRLGNKVALHKTSDDVSPESHQLISYAHFKTTKAMLAAQGIKGNILSYRMRRVRTKVFNVLILLRKINGVVLRHCT